LLHQQTLEAIEKELPGAKDHIAAFDQAIPGAQGLSPWIKAYAMKGRQAADPAFQAEQTKAAIAKGIQDGLAAHLAKQSDPPSLAHKSIGHVSAATTQPAVDKAPHELTDAELYDKLHS
jgi:hypothetical protein